ncbi:unnamed protein product [Colias eurytheme]|nr:unnamed protein product [Colias eurytheme]
MNMYNAITFYYFTPIFCEGVVPPRCEVAQFVSKRARPEYLKRQKFMDTNILYDKGVGNEPRFSPSPFTPIACSNLAEQFNGMKHRMLMITVRLATRTTLQRSHQYIGCCHSAEDCTQSPTTQAQRCARIYIQTHTVYTSVNL